MGAAGDGSGSPAGSIDDEIRAARELHRVEEAAWFVALDGDEKVGMVFGDLAGGEVNVRIWIHPAHRKKGFERLRFAGHGRSCRSLPATPLVVRTPGTMR